MSRIFISYSRQDKAFAQRIARDLEQRGIDVWIDVDDIPGGASWGNAIQEGLDTSDLMLLVVTDDAMQSENVEDEWMYFKSRRQRPIVPLMCKPTEKIHFQLHKLNYIDFCEQEYAAGFEQLCVSLVENGIAVEISSPDVPDVAVPVPFHKTVDIHDLLPQPFEWIEIPAGQVTLEDGHGMFNVSAFAIAKHPITNAQFDVFMNKADNYQKPEPTSFEVDDLPRTDVSWYEAVAFCQWLSKQTGASIMLPTEQQWQRAAQGDDGRMYPWGNQFDQDRCNTSESGIRQTTPVTRYPNGASPYGVMDISGNVWEWCRNEYEAPSNAGLTGNARRVLRGGSWDYSEDLAQCVLRLDGAPDFRDNDCGFRVVCGCPPIL